MIRTDESCRILAGSICPETTEPIQRLLRDHAVIRKLPKQNRYQLTDKGRKLTTLISVLLGASTEQLLQMAA